jgi:signal transduction histidine kinase
MRSLRGNVMLGAALWTTGLLAVWATALTLYGSLRHSIVVVHSYPHSLMLIAILAMAAGFAIVRRGLKPLNELRARLADVQSGRAGRIEGEYPAEVQPVVSDLNALLAHQEQAVSRAIAKAGDLAHGLKTPLAVLANEAERAAAAGHGELAAAMTEQVERMRRQIEYHLAHARAAASGATSGARCAVTESASALARTLLRLHADRGLAIDVQVSDAHVVRCQREDLDEMLGNLLDNACKWAKSRVIVSSAVLPPKGGNYETPGGASLPPKGGSYEIPGGASPEIPGGAVRPPKGGNYEISGPSETVWLPPSGGNGAIAITVDDDGPGVAASMRDAVLQRGVRADEAAAGSGFGLAIVRELAGLYGGAIALDASPAGGLRATLRLPRA